MQCAQFVNSFLHNLRVVSHLWLHVNSSNPAAPDPTNFTFANKITCITPSQQYTVSSFILSLAPCPLRAGFRVPAGLLLATLPNPTLIEYECSGDALGTQTSYHDPPRASSLLSREQSAILPRSSSGSTIPVLVSNGVGSVRGLDSHLSVGGEVFGNRRAGNHGLSVTKEDTIREMVKEIKSRNLNKGGGRKVVGGPWLGETKAYCSFGFSLPLITPAHGLTAIQRAPY